MIASFSLSQVYAEPIIFDGDFIVEKFATGLEYPTTMTFVGEDILVLEKNTGKVIRIKNNGIMYDEPVLEVPVIQQRHGGLLGIDFAFNHVYLYFTESLPGFDENEDKNSRNAVYQYDWNGRKLINPVLIKDLPSTVLSYNSGVITKGQNNEIYFVIGDQYHHLHHPFDFKRIEGFYENGNIFKIDTENNNNVELFAMGIRNSFGLAVDPVTGYLWETENSPDYFDEINLVKPGFNSGWHSIMGPTDRIDSDLYDLNLKQFENFVYSDPEFSWYDGNAVTAIAFPDKDSFRKYSDWLFVGDYNNGSVYKFQLNTDRTGFVFSNPDLLDLVLDEYDEIDEIIFGKGFQGVTDIEFHDGAMYVVSIGEGSIYKIYPKEPLSPLKQYQSGVTYKKIVCKPSLMPIMNKSGFLYCVKPETAITFINVLNWNIDHPEIPKIELRFQDLSGLNFENVNLSNSDFTGSNFDNANIFNVNFDNANLSYTNFSDMDLTGTILTGADLTGITLTGADLSDVDLSGMDLSDAKLVGADLSGKDLTGTILTGADLSNTILTGVNLSGKDLTKAKLRGADLSNAVLTGAILQHASLESVNMKNADFTSADLTSAKFKGTDISMGYLSTMNLRGADLSGAILTNVDLSNKDLTNANLSGQDLSGYDMTNTILTGADLTHAILPNGALSEKDFVKTIFDGVDLSGKEMLDSNFHYASFNNANMENVNLTGSTLIQVDLTNIKNKSLAGAILFATGFAYANLVGVDLSSAILGHNNANNVNLSGVDFTVISGGSLIGVNFGGADLTNANFEGLSLYDSSVYSYQFSDRADWADKSLTELTTELVKIEISQAVVVGKEVVGNDLRVFFKWYTDFKFADLQNVNFSNADLRNSNFFNADLTNANLSNSFLDGAVLKGAILDGAILDGASLNCYGHAICVS